LADPADRADRDDRADQADRAERADWAAPAYRRRSLVRRLEQIVEQGPGYASRDAALALADIDWHAGRTERAAARYADLADLLDGPMRAFCLRRVREARHRPG
jgi:RNA polymerase sigma-70 factor (ECF subfamily)